MQAASLHSNDSRRTAWLLSIVAFAPMAFLAGSLALSEGSNAAILPLLDAFKTFSAITLSYFGGMRWGIARQGGETRPLFLGATMLPPAIGWGSIFLPDAAGIGVLLLAICAMGAWDSFSLNAKPETQWYAKIRTIMTFAMALAHVVVLLVVLEVLR